LALVIEIGNNEVSYLLFWQRYSEDNIVSFLLYFPRITRKYINGGL
jgi:hypothetical protein